MMKYLNFFIVILLLIFLNCIVEKNPIDFYDAQIRSIGSFSFEDVDKNKWGDFQLILELKKSNFYINEPIGVTLTFSNIGHKTIILDGILPYRSSANPPYLDVLSQDGRRYRINKIVDDLLTDNKIIIDSGKHIILMEINLKSVGGTILREHKSGFGYIAEEKDNIGTEFMKGIYMIQGHFYPTPQIYCSYTDTLTFRIE